MPSHAFAPAREMKSPPCIRASCRSFQRRAKSPAATETELAANTAQNLTEAGAGGSNRFAYRLRQRIPICRAEKIASENTYGLFRHVEPITPSLARATVRQEIYAYLTTRLFRTDLTQGTLAAPALGQRNSSTSRMIRTMRP